MESWNPVLNKIVEIKSEFVENFGESELYNYSNETCISYWTKKLDKYKELFEPLTINEFEDLILLRYNNLEDSYNRLGENFWTVNNGFYSECRSVVLNFKKDELVLTPFKKFWNINETSWNAEEKIFEMADNATTVEFSDKLDGSMQCARYYNNRIVMSGSKAINPEKSFRLVSGYGYIFEENYQRMLMDNPHHTFIFELINEADKHVVDYSGKQQGLYLIGIRSVVTGKEYDYKDVLEMADMYGVLTTVCFDTTLNHVLENLSAKKSHEAEGFVVNIDGYKLKIKYDDYVMMHRMIASIYSPSATIKAMAEGKYDDFYSKVPKAYRDVVKKNREIVLTYIIGMEKRVGAYIDDLDSNKFEDKASAMKWINSNVEKSLQKYVRMYYLGQDFNFLRSNQGKLIKMREIEDIIRRWNEDKETA